MKRIALLQSDNIGTVFFGEEELAKGMTRHVLERFAPPDEHSHRSQGHDH